VWASGISFVSGFGSLVFCVSWRSCLMNFAPCPMSVERAGVHARLLPISALVLLLSCPRRTNGQAPPTPSAFALTRRSTATRRFMASAACLASARRAGYLARRPSSHSDVERRPRPNGASPWPRPVACGRGVRISKFAAGNVVGFTCSRGNIRGERFSPKYPSCRSSLTVLNVSPP